MHTAPEGWDKPYSGAPLDVTLKEFNYGIDFFENHIMGMSIDEDSPLHTMVPPWFLKPLEKLIKMGVKTVSCGIDKEANDLGICCEYDGLSEDNKKIVDRMLVQGRYRETFPYTKSGYYKERGRTDLMQKRCFRIFTKFNPNAYINEVSDGLLNSIGVLKSQAVQKKLELFIALVDNICEKQSSVNLPAVRRTRLLDSLRAYTYPFPEPRPGDLSYSIVRKSEHSRDVTQVGVPFGNKKTTFSLDRDNNFKVIYLEHGNRIINEYKRISYDLKGKSYVDYQDCWNRSCKIPKFVTDPIPMKLRHKWHKDFRNYVPDYGPDSRPFTDTTLFHLENHLDYVIQIMQGNQQSDSYERVHLLC